ncbi:MAG: tRNA preQ1(34) S-adenosylmethionine ribosyltransferase-isomerase QueA [Desulfobacula sp.]|uniref:tRNA preQ1(34) S-adenosylmethionine ribosyltransferase-isomerase QueA n=1 Tax=Desulfobacula sp. TaxID=2593537 RepID=UPI0025BABEB1|nr:tRNA preQ1(34) S-adenosylmethionine ribosyltransferase-isomerase QueA [Desulfobacula sp.]MCD4718992.1 tRNA preQ1(34) S-adenosylmethionine ribosyltransferase-isomerase QueA [Desulfobacula sp.]
MSQLHVTFRLSDYDYDLPKEKIAQIPCKNRSGSKLLHLNRRSEIICHHRFKDITALLKSDDLLVINNTKVVPARLTGVKETGGKVEVLIIDYATGMKNLEETGFFKCDCLIKASKNPKKGAKLLLGDEGEAKIEASVEAVNGFVSKIKFLNGNKFLKFLKKSGKIPLPPYIKRDDLSSVSTDREDYQTVYASKEGAVAAPTAGLHFTEALMDDLGKKGIEFAKITLHVGYGTFVPVRVDDIRDHQIHSEYFSLSKENADKINRARRQNRRVVAVGTTSVRTLEFLSDEKGMVTAKTGMCDLFIYPGYIFKCVDAMLTNFHLPESTLLMLVSAFYNREKILDAYQKAINRDYRFFSYGDAMLIE